MIEQPARAPAVSSVAGLETDPAADPILMDHAGPIMLPLPMEINTVCEVRGIVVDDTFGRHTFVHAAGRGPETAWQRFAIFHLTEHGTRSDAAGSLFYLVAAGGKMLESAPIERVNFVRDEMANMACGVEAIVPSQIGQGMSGYDGARSSGGLPAPRTLTNDDVRIAYVAGTTVPGNWIPFVPVHAEHRLGDPAAARAHGRRRPAARTTAPRGEVALLRRGRRGAARRRLRRALVAASAVDWRPDADLGRPPQDGWPWRGLEQPDDRLC